MSNIEALDYCSPPNRVAGEDGFKNKVVLVSGGTGFVGKTFLEKLLRTCPLVKRIYVLIRNKKGSDPQTRLRSVFENPLFDILKKIRGEEIFEKVVAVAGDVGEADLGLSPCDRKLITEEVQFIYHLAATTRFDSSFKTAVLFNTRGTKLMLELAKECKQLLFFLYCSTAYCFPHEKNMREKLYSPPADPQLIIDICEKLDEEAVISMSKVLMRNCPNTYTYSKALSEGVVAREMNNLPITIIRPSVVIGIWKDPLPGWTDNFYGPMGLFIAGGKGIIRTTYCDPNAYLDCIAVDMVANALMLSAWDFMTNRKAKIYNLTSTSEVRYTWHEIAQLALDVGATDMPLNWAVWYPTLCMNKSRLVHQIYVVLFHYIPALFLDALIVLSGNKPVLWKIQQKITKGSELLAFYAMRRWDFNNDELRKAVNQFNVTEKGLYNCTPEGFNAKEYLYNATHGARLYLLKEDDESLPTARRHMKIMWAVDRICKTCIFFGFFYLLYNFSMQYLK